MHGLRWIFSAGTGAVIGVAAVIALDLSYRLLHRPAPAINDDALAAPPRVRGLPHLDPQSWPVKATIIAVAIAAYTMIGYDYRPVAPPAPSAEPVVPAAPTPRSTPGP